MDHKQAYFKDILPEIGNYTLGRDSEVFEAEEIAKNLARYTSEEIETVLEYVESEDEIRHLQETEDGKWSFKAFEPGSWESLDESLEQDQALDPEVPDVSTRVKNLSAQEYGKLRNNLEEVYEGLKDMKNERSSYFSTSDIKERVNNVRPAEIGVVLSGLAAAGLVKKYRDRGDYERESIDTEKIEEFKEAVENAESFETFKEMVKEEKD